MAPTAWSELPLSSERDAEEIIRQLNSGWTEAGCCIAGEGPGSSRMGLALFGIDKDHPPGTPVRFRCVKSGGWSALLDVVITGIRMEEDRPNDHALSNGNYLFWGWVVSWCRGDGRCTTYRMLEPIRVGGLYSLDRRDGRIYDLPKHPVIEALRRILASHQPGIRGQGLTRGRFDRYSNFEADVGLPGNISARFRFTPLSVGNQDRQDEGILAGTAKVVRLITPDGNLEVRPDLIVAYTYNLSLQMGSIRPVPVES